ncbi:uncharacterized protein F5891DRAFT_957342, partial [Suillus fuscotomentosus]
SGKPLNHSFWQQQVDTETPGYRNSPLPLTRIKKVIKSDPVISKTSLLFSAIISLYPPWRQR